MRRLIAQFVSVWVLLAAAAILVPGTASAHSVLKSSNPSAGQVLRAAPESIELVFNEHLRPNSSQIAITIGDETPVEIDLAETEDSLTADLTAADLPEVAEGEAVRWKIGYRIVSEDNHPVSGVVEFVVDRTLLASVPAQGAVLSEIPSALDLTFARPIAAADPVAVTAGGTAEQQVAAQVGGDRVQIPLDPTQFAPGTPGDEWRIGYRVTAADGAVLTGLLTFTIDPATGAAPVVPEPLTERPADLVPTSDPAPASTSVAAPSIGGSPAVTESSSAAGAVVAEEAAAESAGGVGAVLWIVIGVVLVAAFGGVLVWRARHRSSTG